MAGKSFRDFLAQRAYEFTQKKLSTFNQIADTPNGPQWGKTNTDFTKATLPDGSEVDIIARDTPREYTPLLKLNSSTYLAQERKLRAKTVGSSLPVFFYGLVTETTSISGGGFTNPFFYQLFNRIIFFDLLTGEARLVRDYGFAAAMPASLTFSHNFLGSSEIYSDYEYCVGDCVTPTATVQGPRPASPTALQTRSPSNYPGPRAVFSEEGKHILIFRVLNYDLTMNSEIPQSLLDTDPDNDSDALPKRTRIINTTPLRFDFIILKNHTIDEDTGEIVTNETPIQGQVYLPQPSPVSTDFRTYFGPDFGAPGCVERIASAKPFLYEDEDKNLRLDLFVKVKCHTNIGTPGGNTVENPNSMLYNIYSYWLTDVLSGGGVTAQAISNTPALNEFTDIYDPSLIRVNNKFVGYVSKAHLFHDGSTNSREEYQQVYYNGTGDIFTGGSPTGEIYVSPSPTQNPSIHYGSLVSDERYFNSTEFDTGYTDIFTNLYANYTKVTETITDGTQIWNGRSVFINHPSKRYGYASAGFGGLALNSNKWISAGSNGKVNYINYNPATSSFTYQEGPSYDLVQFLSFVNNNSDAKNVDLYLGRKK